MSEVEKVARAIRKHVRVDATGLSPAVAGAFIVGVEEAAREIVALSAMGGERPSLASYASPNVYDGVRAHPPRREAVEEAVKAERDAWLSELRPLIDAGALEGVTLHRCERCGALLTIDEIAPANDWKGCWRSATGRDKDPCQNESRPRIAAAIRGDEK